MSFTLTFAKPSFKFSCAHFTIFDEKRAERLHGHNYRVSVQLKFDSTKADSGLAVEFSKIKPHIQEICDQWDEHILLPEMNPLLSLKHLNGEIEVRFNERRYVFPEVDVHRLASTNSSSEELSRLFAKELSRRLQAITFLSMSVQIGETDGQSATYHLQND